MKAIRKKTIENILNNKSVKGIDYIDFRNPENLDEIKDPEGFRQNTGHSKILIAAAIWIVTTRLIDNIVI